MSGTDSNFINVSIRNCKEIGNGALFLSNNFTCAIIWTKKSYFLFDPHGHDDQGILTGDGTSILLEFQLLDDLEVFIREVFFSHTEENQYEIQYIKIERSEQALSAITLTSKRLRENQRKNLKRKQISNNPEVKQAINEKRRMSYDDIKGTDKYLGIQERKRQNSQLNFDIVWALKNTKSKKNASAKVLN